MNYHEIKRLEKASQWEEAAKEWRLIGYKNDAEICQYIADAIKAGDAFKAKVLELCGPEPARDNSHEWVKWFNGMEKVYFESKN